VNMVINFRSHNVWGFCFPAERLIVLSMSPIVGVVYWINLAEVVS
jgi:hypothetical protein